MEQSNTEIPLNIYEIDLYDSQFVKYPKTYFQKEDKKILDLIKKIQKNAHGSDKYSEIRQDLQTDQNGLDQEQIHQLRLQYNKLYSPFLKYLYQSLYYKVLKPINIFDQYCNEYRKKHCNTNGLVIRLICCDCNSILALDYRNPHNILVNLQKPHQNCNHKTQKLNYKKKQQLLGEEIEKEEEEEEEEEDTEKDQMNQKDDHEQNPNFEDKDTENNQDRNNENEEQQDLSSQNIYSQPQKVSQNKEMDDINSEQDNQDIPNINSLGLNQKQNKDKQMQVEEADYITGNLIPYAMNKTSGFNQDWFKAIQKFKNDKQLEWIKSFKTHYEQVETTIGVSGKLFCYCCNYKPTINENNMADYSLKQAVVIRGLQGDMSWQCIDYDIVEKHISYDQRKDSSNLIKEIHLNGKIYYSCMMWVKYERSNAYPVRVDVDLHKKKPSAIINKKTENVKRSGLPLKKVSQYKGNK